MPPSGQGGHVQRLAQHRVAALGQAGFPGPFAGLLDLGIKARMGDRLLGVVEAVMVAERHQQVGQCGFADAGNGVQQVPATPKVGVVVDVLARECARGLPPTPGRAIPEWF